MRSVAATILLPLLAVACTSYPAALAGDTVPPSPQNQAMPSISGVPSQQDLRRITDQARDQMKRYQGYLEERIAEIRRLDAGVADEVNQAEIHNLYVEFTRLCNELQENMDVYERQHADLRKELKAIGEKGEKWPAALNGPKPNTEYEFARQTALAAAQSLMTDTKEMLNEQTKSFEDRKRTSK